MDISRVGLVIGPGGAIATARADLSAGTQIGVPANLVLNQQTASAQSPQLAAAFEATAERGLTLPSDIGTAMALMYETFHNPASFWAPYVMWPRVLVRCTLRGVFTSDPRLRQWPLQVHPANPVEAQPPVLLLR